MFAVDMFSCLFGLHAESIANTMKLRSLTLMLPFDFRNFHVNFAEERKQVDTKHANISKSALMLLMLKKCATIVSTSRGNLPGHHVSLSTEWLVAAL